MNSKFFQILAMAAMFGASIPPMSRYYKDTKEPKKPTWKPFILKDGNGKHLFTKETAYGLMQVLADTQKSANKKFRTLEGINCDIQYNHKDLTGYYMIVGESIKPKYDSNGNIIAQQLTPQTILQIYDGVSGRIYKFEDKVLTEQELLKYFIK